VLVCLLLRHTAAAFRSGAVMGFLLAGFGLLNLYLGIMIFKAVRMGTTQLWG
jgi:Na+/H+-translocating membrane pyrophosphatase